MEKMKGKLRRRMEEKCKKAAIGKKEGESEDDKRG